MIWEIDSAHSRVSFAVLSFAVTKGRFNSLRGRISIDEEHPGNSWVEAEVDAASIDTGNRLRDAHLRSPTFFAVKRYPVITFQSTTVEQTSELYLQGDGQSHAAGNNETRNILGRAQRSSRWVWRLHVDRQGDDQPARLWSGPGPTGPLRGQPDSRR